MTLMDDLEKYEVHVDVIPVWYFDTIKEFLALYCFDMHPKNKALLLELLGVVERREKGKSKVIELKRKAV